jgi:hypothetical protein
MTAANRLRQSSDHRRRTASRPRCAPPESVQPGCRRRIGLPLRSSTRHAEGMDGRDPLVDARDAVTELFPRAPVGRCSAGASSIPTARPVPTWTSSCFYRTVTQMLLVVLPATVGAAGGAVRVRRTQPRALPGEGTTEPSAHPDSHDRDRCPPRRGSGADGSPPGSVCERPRCRTHAPDGNRARCHPLQAHRSSRRPDPRHGLRRTYGARDLRLDQRRRSDPCALTRKRSRASSVTYSPRRAVRCSPATRSRANVRRPLERARG